MRVNLDRALRRWQEQGLLDAAAVAAIREFEAAHRKPVLARSAYLLGGFAIAVGIIALVAANWRLIPDGVKLTAHFALNVAAGLALVAAHRREIRMAAEVLALVSFALVLTLTALIGQIYQIQSPLWVGLSTWLVLGTPLVLLFARSGFVITVWLLALLCAVGSLGQPLVDWLANQDWIGDYRFPALAGVYGAYPAALFAIGRLIPEQPETQTMKRVIMAFALFLIVAAASLAQFLWYVGGEDSNEIGPLVGRVLCVLWLALIGAASLALARRDFDGREYRSLVVVVVACLGLGATPYLLAPVDFHPMSAVLQIVLWGVIGWTGVVSGRTWVGRLAIGLIAVRIVVVYFEVFGTLVQTGVGLIVSGIVVIAITFAAVRAQGRLMTWSGGSP